MWNRIRNWLLIKLANGNPVIMNVVTGQAISVRNADNKSGLFWNIRIESTEYWPNNE